MRNMLKVFGLFLAVALLVQPKLVYADRGGHGGHHYYRYHDRPSFGLRVSVIPDGFFSLWVGGRNYYYYDGLYYNRVGPDYVIVQPPVGAVVTTIPPELHPVIINGVTYYTDNVAYYVYTRYGYQVVPQPVQIVQPAPVVVTQPAPAAAPAPTEVKAVAASPGSEESYAVNIPNDKGGYTAVTLKRTDKGFIGPQGEFYPEFPKVAQLKAMYGK